MLIAHNMNINTKFLRIPRTYLTNGNDMTTGSKPNGQPTRVKDLFLMHGC